MSMGMNTDMDIYMDRLILLDIFTYMIFCILYQWDIPYVLLWDILLPSSKN
jgi:hypothetical protein